MENREIMAGAILFSAMLVMSMYLATAKDVGVINKWLANLVYVPFFLLLAWFSYTAWLLKVIPLPEWSPL